jgi:hypothetical protein
MQNANERIGQGEKMNTEKSADWDKEQLKQIQLNNARQEIDNNQRIEDRKRDTISIRIEQARRNVEVLGRLLIAGTLEHLHSEEIGKVLLNNLKVLKEMPEIK